MLDSLTLPPRLVLRALDDLHTLAEGLRGLSGREGDLQELLDSVRILPAVEDQLSARIDSLETAVGRLQEWLQPLHRELTDLDDTAEKLERALAEVNATIAGLHRELQELRDRIPGL